MSSISIVSGRACRTTESEERGGVVSGGDDVANAWGDACDVRESRACVSRAYVDVDVEEEEQSEIHVGTAPLACPWRDTIPELVTLNL